MHLYNPDQKNNHTTYQSKMSLPIPVKLIAELTDSRYSNNLENSLNLMIKLMLAFPQYFDILSENVYWEMFLPLIVRNKKEADMKFGKGKIYEFFKNNWNRNFKQYQFKKPDGPMKKILTLTRKRELCLHFTPNAEKIKPLWFHKFFPGQISNIFCSPILIFVKTINPRKLYLNVQEDVADGYHLLGSNISCSNGQIHINFAEFLPINNSMIARLDLAYQMAIFEKKCDETGISSFYLFDQRRGNTGSLNILFDELKIPKFTGNNIRQNRSDDDEDILEIKKTKYIGDESNAPSGFTLFDENSKEKPPNVVLSRIYAVKTPTKSLYCIFGYFGSDCRVIRVPDQYTELLNQNVI